MIKFGSVCSGIEAASVAWHPLGWEAAWLSEIEKFPSQVLAHHYPNTPNLGDMTKFKEWSSDSAINVLVGGTPCQSFSVAGLRKGLDDPRGNLMLTYLAIAAKYRPRWLVWENVPGVLSSNGGLDFASLLRGMGELGYGFAYRVLDAQYFGVAQRRRRVFVVGYLGNWQCAAAVLFERYSLCGYPAPSREKRERVADTLTVGANQCSGFQGDFVEAQAMIVAGSLCARTGQSISVQDAEQGHLLAQPIALAENTIGRKPENGGNGDGFTENGPMYTLNATGVHGVAQPINIYGGNKRTDRPEGGFYVRMGEETSKTLDAASGLNPTCSQGGTAVMQPIAFVQNQRDEVRIMQVAGALAAEPGMKQQTYLAQAMAVAQPIGIFQDSEYGVKQYDSAGTLRAGRIPEHQMAIQPPYMQVRRLTPTECERLQGFPDGYTDIKHGGKSTPDGPRYKALGNSMAVPVMAWIGKRIQEVEEILG